MQEALIASVVNERKGMQLRLLSTEERTVLAHFARGMTVEDTALTMHLSGERVLTDRHSIWVKLQQIVEAGIRGGERWRQLERRRAG